MIPESVISSNNQHPATLIPQRQIVSANSVRSGVAQQAILQALAEVGFIVASYEQYSRNIVRSEA